MYISILQYCDITDITKTLSPLSHSFKYTLNIPTKGRYAEYSLERAGLEDMEGG